MKARSIAAVVTVALGLALTTSVLALADDGFGTMQPDRHVYDSASLLTSDEVASLERQAASMSDEGAPTVVYLRVKAADTSVAQQDARDLMTAWQVESSPGSRDGLVLLLDLTPGDTRHGSAALVAGAHHVDDGRLNADRLQAIYDSRMMPRLVAGDLAGAISGALDLAATDLQQPAQTTQSDQSDQSDQSWGGLLLIPLFIVGMVVVGVFNAWGRRVGLVRRSGGHWVSTGSTGSSSFDSGGSSDSGSTSGGSDSGGGSF